MKRALIITIVLILAFSSCRHISERRHNSNAYNKAESPIDSGILVMSEHEGKIIPFVVFGINDTLFVPDTGKVNNISKVGDEIYYYTHFESFQHETDFGRRSLIVRNYRNELLWSLALEDYTQIVSNKSYILIIYFEKDILNYYNSESGEIIKSIKLNENLSDGNEVIITDDNTYIKLINEENATTRDIMLINNTNFEWKLLDLKLNGYYSLKRENCKVFIQSGNEKRYLN